jgi:predicted AlkP superfamily phosphohydrolase/phosphomutase
MEITVRPDPAGRRVVIHSAGTPQELEVPLGSWSDWLKVKFKHGLLQAVRGLVRFHLVTLEPELELYASPVNFDPDLPLFPISAPPQFAGDLAWRIGLYHTTGMVEDHAGLNNERISEAAFLDQCATAWREREAMMTLALEQFEGGLFYCLFDTPDRVQHMFWRFGEPDHPAHRGKPPGSEFAGVIEECYRRCDAVVGKVLEFADDQTLLIALSDHGFNGFRRGVHLNTWLHDQGFLALQDGIRPGEDAGDLLRYVDWGRTKAYALGLSGIYLNLQGREDQGIVSLDEADNIKAAIAQGLTGLRDGQRGGELAIRGVRPRDDVYHGPYVAEAPDLLVNYASGYRVSWSSSMGGVAEGYFEDNVKKWSGDHIIDPALVPGVLFMNRPFRGDGAHLLDLAPTITTALGVPQGPAMEGKSLLS